MENEKPHAKFLLQVDPTGHGSPVGLGRIEISGCKACLVELLKHALLHSPGAKELFNLAARAANAETAKAAEKKPSINPNLN
ncbi:MAG TPA: hypothetical protein VGM41_16615 [Chitinophagaceae bacterium]